VKTIKLNVEYATQALNEIPVGYINKSVCGCGMTSVVLENYDDTILLVPNIELATNKAKQYPNERTSNTLLPVWGDTSAEKIVQYITTTTVIKIVCVYDSLHKVEHLLDRCSMIIDEAQELLPLSRNPERARAISKLFEIASKYKDKVSFISATPTPLNYLPPWVSDIPQITYEWSNSCKVVPIVYQHAQPYRVLRHEILAPLNENKTVTISGKTFGKVIVFMNTVEQISRIISDVNIEKSKCAIICGDNIRNDLKIKGIPRLKNPSNLPIFTFITASGFKGIDLYDTQAMTIVVSNTQKKWQMVDILTDLKQAVSRQRKKDNPNYGTYIYIFNQTKFTKSEEELIAELDEIRDKISDSVKLWDLANASGLLKGWPSDNDIQAYTHLIDGKLEMNEMAFSADRYFILELRKQYVKGFDILGNFEESTNIEVHKLPADITYAQMAQYFNNNHRDGTIDWGAYSHKINWIETITNCYKLYGKVWENVTYTNQMIKSSGDPHSQLLTHLKSRLKEGNTYSVKNVKSILNDIYKEIKLNKVANTKDLNTLCKYSNQRTSSSTTIKIAKYYPG